MANIEFHRWIMLFALCLSLEGPLSAQAPPVATPTAPEQKNSRNPNAPSDDDTALAKANSTLQADPKNVHAYVKRAAIYGDQKLWGPAERDYETALALAPNSPLIKFDLAEIKFQQRRFDEARPGFASLQSDPDLGDLAAYKVFLCDLMGRHDPVAIAELDAFNKASKNPSYYYSNAAWDLSHDKLDEGRSWFNSATHIYSRAKNALYAESLLELSHIDAPTVTFTTKKGQTFSGVQVTMEEGGLRLLADNGAITIPVNQLPDDLSAFPEKLRRQIEAVRAPVVAGVKVPSFTTKQGQKYENVEVVVESGGLSVHSTSGWMTVPFDQLPDDLSSFSDDIQKQIALRKNPLPDTTRGVKLSSLTTKQGKTFHNVEAFMEGSGLRLRTTDGWTSVPLDQLPDDLSGFPDDLKNQIIARRIPVSEAASGIAVSSLTTRQGKKYENVQVFVEADDLRFQSGGDWVTVPFDQLPDDLSSLPDVLEKEIAARRKPVSDVASGIKLASLTTKDGKHYANLNIFVEADDLRCQVAGDWVTIPFDQLPNDRSAFPPELQRAIAARQPAVPK